MSSSYINKAFLEVKTDKYLSDTITQCKASIDNVISEYGKGVTNPKLQTTHGNSPEVQFANYIRTQCNLSLESDAASIKNTTSTYIDKDGKEQLTNTKTISSPYTIVDHLTDIINEQLNSKEYQKGFDENGNLQRAMMTLKKQLHKIGEHQSVAQDEQRKADLKELSSTKVEVRQPDVKQATPTDNPPSITRAPAGVTKPNDEFTGVSSGATTPDHNKPKF